MNWPLKHLQKGWGKVAEQLKFNYPRSGRFFNLSCPYLIKKTLKVVKAILQFLITHLSGFQKEMVLSYVTTSTLPSLDRTMLVTLCGISTFFTSVIFLVSQSLQSQVTGQE